MQAHLRRDFKSLAEQHLVIENNDGNSHKDPELSRGAKQRNSAEAKVAISLAELQEHEGCNIQCVERKRKENISIVGCLGA